MFLLPLSILIHVTNLKFKIICHLSSQYIPEITQTPTKMQIPIDVRRGFTKVGTNFYSRVQLARLEGLTDKQQGHCPDSQSGFHLLTVVQG